MQIYNQWQELSEQQIDDFLGMMVTQCKSIPTYVEEAMTHETKKAALALWAMGRRIILQTMITEIHLPDGSLGTLKIHKLLYPK